MRIQRLRTLAAFLLIAAMALIPVAIEHHPSHEDEGTSICRSHFTGFRLFYFPETSGPPAHETITYGTLFIEQQPLYYFALRIWNKVFQPRTASMRHLSILFYFSGLVFFFLYVRRQFRGRYLAHFLLACLALTPFLIFHAQYIREYSLFFATGCLNLLFYFRYKREERLTNAYLISMLLFGFTHFFAYIPLFIQFISIMRSKNFPWKHSRFLFGATLILLAGNALLRLPVMFFMRYYELDLIPSAQAQTQILKGLLLPLISGSFIFFPWPLFIAAPFFFGPILFLTLTKRLTPEIRYHLGVTFVALVTFVFLNSALRMEEIELRYFIYIFPSLVVLLGYGLEELERYPALHRVICISLLGAKSIGVLFFVLGYPSLLNNYQIIAALRTPQPVSVAYTDDFRLAECHVRTHFDADFYPKQLQLRPLNAIVRDRAPEIRLLHFNPSHLSIERELELKKLGYHRSKTTTFAGTFPGEVSVYTKIP